jgi:N utilization substance protein B
MTPHAPSRHLSRRAALQVLYAADLAVKASDADVTPMQEVFDRVATHFDLHAGARSFAWDLVAGVAAEREALDRCIAEHARNWRVDRMAAVDRNVLRLAAFELLRTDTPRSVVLNEAVELARDFGAERSPSFVNGVLDAIAEDSNYARFAAGGAPCEDEAAPPGSDQGS